MSRPSWFNGSLFRPRALPAGTPQPTAPPQLLDVTPAGPLFTRLLPANPPSPGFQFTRPNYQVGAQPERQRAVLAGHTVTGAYLLHGLPIGVGAVPRLTASPELDFHPNPVASGGGGLALGPEAPLMVLDRRS